MTLTNLFGLCGGLGLFLYGMKLMSDALQDMAGDSLRRLVAAITSTPFRGVMIGTIVTMIIQSSSATTVMIVSFVQAGLMGVQQALAVSMGANVGTTITAQLVAFKIDAYALPIIAIGMALALFGRTKKQRYFGHCCFGFGLLFLGLTYMSSSMKFLAQKQDFFLTFSHHPLLGILAGMVLTMVVQSSSATMGLTIALAAQGAIPLGAAIPIVLGNNIGTTITVVLASIPNSREAKQAALGHVFFNVVGMLIFLPFLSWFGDLVALTSDSVPRQIANAHSIFNIAATVIMFPFIRQIAALLQKVMPVDQVEHYSGPQYLTESLLHTSPAAAVEAVKNEVVRAADIAVEMVRDAKKAVLEGSSRAIERLKVGEERVNELNHAVADYAARLWHRHISPDLSVALASYVNGMSDVERVGDHCENLREMAELIRERKLAFTSAGQEELTDLFNLAEEAMMSATDGVRNEDIEAANRAAIDLENQIDNREKTLREHHIERLNKGQCTAEGGIAFVDILSNLERIGDHAHNFAMIVRDLQRLHHGNLQPLHSEETKES